MLRAFLRLLIAVGGAVVAAIVVVPFEVRTVLASEGQAGGRAPALGLLLSGLGVLFPLAVGIGALVGVTMLVLDPGEATSPLSVLREWRRRPVLERLRVATAAPIFVGIGFGWCVACAHAARVTLGSGVPAASGAATALAALAAMAVIVTIGLAVAPLLRRLLAVASGSVPWAIDPAFTGGVALAFAGALLAFGIASGDVGGGGGILGIFGVLARPELDLRPVAGALVLALGAYAAPIAASRRAIGAPGGGVRRHAIVAGAAAFGLSLALFALCVEASASMNADEAIRSGLEKEAPLGKIAVAALRKATDRDRDGYSARFGGGDCDDHDRSVNPGAVDVPGNGIDEDCSGEDTPEVAAEEPPRPKAGDAAARKPARPLNVVLITIDTLRAEDLGFMGSPRSTSPNLDALAAKSAVFENAYAMASYTGKAVGPMLIGKYPSETARNFSHFDTYFSSNVFVAERMHDAGLRTFAGMCHWYFKPSSGLSQGFDVWDSSAIPPGMSDNDTSVSSDRLSDLALALLSDAENVTPGGQTGRFFAWFHYFDPHAQYVPHKGAPDFSENERLAGGKNRDLYDGEIWFTDKQIGRVLEAIERAPWGKDTAIVVTADHGEAFGDHGMSWHGREIWEGLVRVPLLIYVPDAKPRRVSVKRSQIDLAPTLLELAGVPVPEEPGELQGRSLLEDALAPADAELEERDVFVDMPKGPFNEPRRAVITGKTPGTKLIHFGGRSYQLYDLAGDPTEKEDLAKDKDRREAAIARLLAIRARLKEYPVKEKKD